MIALLDYGAGNAGSVLKAVQYLGYPAEPVDRPELLSRAEKIIFPGQGHFGAMMRALTERRLLGPLRGGLAAGKAFLGICLGLEALYELSDEAPGVAGLGLLSGRVKRLAGIFKVPHVGWSQITIKLENPLFRGVPDQSFVYYCHSYYGPVTDATVAVTDYGQTFAAAVAIGSPGVTTPNSGRVWAVQFHPEKSGEVGLEVLRNFLEL